MVGQARGAQAVSTRDGSQGSSATSPRPLRMNTTCAFERDPDATFTAMPMPAKNRPAPVMKRAPRGRSAGRSSAMGGDTSAAILLVCARPEASRGAYR